jgi:hypothetical protein
LLQATALAAEGIPEVMAKLEWWIGTTDPKSLLR